ncbi:MAG: hypothetical protein DRQ40_01985 [Gammaproteobacteria bacterium]|nr:MAG: hypothetical protein DRQ40_01985 [Gammaproteobacteria bacterium]
MPIELEIVEPVSELSTDTTCIQTKSELLKKLQNISRMRLCLQLKSLCKDFECIKTLINRGSTKKDFYDRK